ncbi:DUF3122 domain-containing protein [Lyngbya sp. PCC 8106]|uniref:DUF3122 domain-containing protein n=1 Tax=Lyngbya sp. (strain PCC 8106) TaxID=313612 RepID=UPI0000EAC7A8|nr:DUF3122 domain-containing protein [Lyngbya sp. PCC 8106]EAW38625.1 hypothetical protein L8106_14460 [Lyngbya sp. PCC 8106]
MKSWNQWRLFFAVILFLSLQLLTFSPAWASIHRYPESENQVMYRSKQSLRDRHDLSWQVILFKRIKFGQVNEIHLRLVGFPGLTEFAHRQPLKLTTATGKTWQAEDVVDLSLPRNVGEYDVSDLLLQIENDIPLELALPLAEDQIVELPVPPYIVREWRKLLDLNELSYKLSGNLSFKTLDL